MDRIKECLASIVTENGQAIIGKSLVMVFCIGLIASHAPMYGAVEKHMSCSHAPLRIKHDDNTKSCFTWTQHK